MPAEQQDVLDAVAELCGALDRCEAELLTARERHEEFKRVAMKEAELAQEERDSHAKAASEAMAREKALREALERIANKDHDRFNPWHEALQIARAALAASPSEKPGSEEECPGCGGDASDSSFDRSLCACGSMHYYCANCGAQLDECSDAD